MNFILGQIYFATTRDDTGETSLQYRFGDARTDVVKCGQIAVAQGNLTDFVGTVTADTEFCFSQLKTIAQSGKRLLIFVHGIRNRFSDAVEGALILKEALGESTNVALWSWPAKRDGLSADYSYDKESVGGIAQRRFVGLLNALRAGASAGNVSLLGHSMGGWHILGALQTLSDQDSRPFLHNVVLAAPDVPMDEFKFALDAFSHLSNRSTLYACGWDVALKLSQYLLDAATSASRASSLRVSSAKYCSNCDWGIGLFASGGFA
jgi:esterase/lipase superfamily enzyme